jgi:hypothetical protein
MIYDIIFSRVLNCYHFISLQRTPKYNDTENDMSVYISMGNIQIFELFAVIKRNLWRLRCP